MGNMMTQIAAVTQIKVVPDVDSIYEPGKKSVLSEPIMKWQYIDFEDFWETVCLHSKTPLTVTDYPLLKDLDFKELGPNESEVKATLDGLLLKSINDPRAHGENGMDDLRVLWVKVSIDQEKRLITSEALNPQDGSTTCWQFAMFHFNQEDESFRVESWVDMPDGERRAGPQWSSFVEWCYLKPHLFARHFGKNVQVRSLQPAPHDPDLRIVITNGLTETFEDPEEFFNSFVALFKQEAVEGHGTVDYGDDENNFVLAMVLELSPEIKIPTVRSVSLKPESLEMTVQIKLKSPDGELVDFATHYWKVYSDPVRLGFWVKRPRSMNLCGASGDTIEMAYRLYRLTSEKDVIKEVESLDEKNFFL